MILFRKITNNGMIHFVTYSTLIGGFFRLGRPKTALKLLYEMQGCGKHPNV